MKVKKKVIRTGKLLTFSGVAAVGLAAHTALVGVEPDRGAAYRRSADYVADNDPNARRLATGQPQESSSKDSETPRRS